MSTRKQWCFTINNYNEDDGIDDTSLCQYLIEAHEMGDDNTPHLQGYVVLLKPLRLNQISALMPRAHIEASNGTPWENFLYCTKGEQSKVEWAEMKSSGPNFGLNADFLEWGVRPKEPAPSHKKKPKDTTYAEVLAARTVKEGLAIIASKRPRDYCMHLDTLERHLKRQKIEPRPPKYNLEDFNHPPLQFEKAILLCGPSGFGKTQYALAHFTNPLLVRQIDSLKDLTEEHDGIVFDDMSFNHRPAESIIHLLDVEENTVIYCRYGNAKIPANMPRIFTHNTCNPFYLDIIPSEQKAAIERRLERIEISEPLFGTTIAIIQDEDSFID